jgi:hypothetical protein
MKQAALNAVTQMSVARQQELAKIPASVRQMSFATFQDKFQGDLDKAARHLCL